MRFLIVDDDPAKIDALRQELISNGLVDSDITACDTAASARKALESVSFDAMLLDVLLPARKNAVASGEHSVELLKQIIDDGTSVAPRYIFGVTADPAAMKAFQSEFRQMTLQVIHVAPDQNEWKSFLNSLVRFMRRTQEAEHAYIFDVAVLDALRDPELNAVLSSWPMQLDAESLLNSSVLYQTGTGIGELQGKKIVCAHPAQVGPVASAHAAESVIRKFRPRVLVMTGICGGFSDQVALGDVIVAERSWDWQAGKWTDEGVLQASVDQRMASAALLAKARTISAEDMVELHSKFEGAKPPTPPKVVLGPMVTGSSVVASTDIQKAFRTQHRKMVGVDMECFGLYYAAAVSAEPRTEVICIKAVSDLADRDKSDKLQAYCSYISANIALRLVARHFRDSP